MDPTTRGRADALDHGPLPATRVIVRPCRKRPSCFGKTLRGLAHDRLELAALETQRAGESLVAMVVAGMLVAGLLLSAWLGLLGAAILALTSLGVMATGSALLLAVRRQFAIALMLWRHDRPPES